MAFLIFLILAGIAAGLGVYFLPTIIALCRNHRRKLAVFFLNLFLGWTFFGWLGALVWSIVG